MNRSSIAIELMCGLSVVGTQVVLAVQQLVDFQTPPHLIEAVHRAMRDGYNGYAPSAGIPAAREAIARECMRTGIPGVTPSDVVVTSGASEALELALTALLEPGERVLLPCPGYPLYNALMAKLNARDRAQLVVIAHQSGLVC